VGQGLRSLDSDKMEQIRQVLISTSEAIKAILEE
jgi:hypothetical protein